MYLFAVFCVQPAMTSRGLKEGDFVQVRRLYNGCNGCRSRLLMAATGCDNGRGSYRGFGFVCRQVADFLDRAVKIALRIQSTSGKLLKDFTAALDSDAELAVRSPVVAAVVVVVATGHLPSTFLPPVNISPPPFVCATRCCARK